MLQQSGRFLMLFFGLFPQACRDNPKYSWICTSRIPVISAESNISHRNTRKSRSVANVLDRTKNVLVDPRL